MATILCTHCGAKVIKGHDTYFELSQSYTVDDDEIFGRCDCESRYGVYCSLTCLKIAVDRFVTNEERLKDERAALPLKTFG